MPPNPDLTSYIQKQVATGASRSQIAKDLIAAGWDSMQVNESLNALNIPITGMAPAQVPVAAPTPAPVAIAPQAAPAFVAPPPASPPPPTVQPPPISIPVMATPVALPKKSFIKTRAASVIIAIAVPLFLGVGIAYAYVENIGPFAHTPYSGADTLLTGVLTKGALIKTGTYNASVKVTVEPRDSDAVAFSLPNDPNFAAEYARDYKRASSIEKIAQTLNYRTTVLPSSLQQLTQSNATRAAYYAISTSDITDPLTNQKYAYALSSDGKDYTLQVTFETATAVSAIQKLNTYSTHVPMVSGNTFTFSKSSTSLVYLSSTPPEPFIQQLQDATAYLSPAFNVTASVAATTDFTSATADWKFNIDADGDMGDLTYKANLDALRKNGIFYFRLNNFPSILGDFASYKGVWIKVDPAATSTGSLSEYAGLASTITSSESGYKDSRAQTTKLLADALRAAQSSGFITIQGTPSKETVGNRTLYRYNLGIKKEGVVAFYTTLADEAKTATSSPLALVVADPTLLEYLKSSDFDQLFDYFSKNTALTLWVDAQGYPAQLDYTMRLVPSDTAIALKDKQIKVDYLVTLSDINQPVSIPTPADSKPLEDVIAAETAATAGPLGIARAKGVDALIESDMNTIQTQAELYYGNHSSYGASVALGTCKPTAGTLFSDSTIQGELTGIAKNNLGATHCAVGTNGGAYAVEASLSTTGLYFCVDSTGNSETETKVLAGSKCP